MESQRRSRRQLTRNTEGAAAWRDFCVKNQKGIWFAVGMACFLIAGLVAANFPSDSAPDFPSGAAEPHIEEFDTDIDLETGEPEAFAPEPTEQEREWVLYITGAVRRPGLYSLPAESRLFNLVEAAGGLSVSSNPSAVNMAALLEDGLHVHVPEKGEEPPTYGAYTGVSGAGGPPARSNTRQPKTGSLKATPQAVNINRASAEELTALKGIGPALAGNIVEYRRKNGRFHEVDDLLRVKGIGHKKLEQFRNSVTVRP